MIDLKRTSNPMLKHGEEPPRVIDGDTSRRREQMLIASLITHPTEAVGPNIASALAHAPEWWDDPVSGRIAKAICLCARNNRSAHPCNVAEYLPPDMHAWLANPAYSDNNSLPLSVAECEAFDLVARYRGKRLASLVGQAAHNLKQHPERGRDIARKLRADLVEFA